MSRLSGADVEMCPHEKWSAAGRDLVMRQQPDGRPLWHIGSDLIRSLCLVSDVNDKPVLFIRRERWLWTSAFLSSQVWPCVNRDDILLMSLFSHSALLSSQCKMFFFFIKTFLNRPIILCTILCFCYPALCLFLSSEEEIEPWADNCQDCKLNT